MIALYVSQSCLMTVMSCVFTIQHDRLPAVLFALAAVAWGIGGVAHAVGQRRELRRRRRG